MATNNVMLKDVIKRKSSNEHKPARPIQSSSRTAPRIAIQLNLPVTTRTLLDLNYVTSNCGLDRFTAILVVGRALHIQSAGTTPCRLRRPSPFKRGRLCFL